MLQGFALFFAGMSTEEIQSITYNLAVSFWFLCGFVWIFMYWSMGPDEDAVKAELRQRGAARDRSARM